MEITKDNYYSESQKDRFKELRKVALDHLSSSTLQTVCNEGKKYVWAIDSFLKELKLPDTTELEVLPTENVGDGIVMTVIKVDDLYLAFYGTEAQFLSSSEDGHYDWSTEENKYENTEPTLVCPISKPTVTFETVLNGNADAVDSYTHSSYSY